MIDPDISPPLYPEAYSFDVDDELVFYANRIEDPHLLEDHNEYVVMGHRLARLQQERKILEAKIHRVSLEFDECQRKIQDQCKHESHFEYKMGEQRLNDEALWLIGCAICYKQLRTEPK